MPCWPIQGFCNLLSQVHEAHKHCNFATLILISWIPCAMCNFNIFTRGYIILTKILTQCLLVFHFHIPALWVLSNRVQWIQHWINLYELQNSVNRILHSPERQGQSLIYQLCPWVPDHTILSLITQFCPWLSLITHCFVPDHTLFCPWSHLIVPDHTLFCPWSHIVLSLILGKTIIISVEFAIQDVSVQSRV